MTMKQSLLAIIHVNYEYLRCDIYWGLRTKLHGDQLSKKQSYMMINNQKK